MLGIVLSPLVKKLLPYVLVAAGAVGVVVYVDNRAYHRGWDAASAAQLAAAAVEATRVAEANAQAIQEALRTIDQLTAQKELRDAQIDELIREAESDATAGSTALPPASVRRLNSVD